MGKNANYQRAREGIERANKWSNLANWHINQHPVCAELNDLSFLLFTKKEIASMTQKECGCHPHQFINEQKQFFQFQQ